MSIFRDHAIPGKYASLTVMHVSILRFNPLIRAFSDTIYPANLGRHGLSTRRDTAYARRTNIKASIWCKEIKYKKQIEELSRILDFFKPSKRVAKGAQSDIALERPQDGELPPSKDPRTIEHRQP